MYPSNLSDKEWNTIKHLFVDGNRAKHDKRDLINGVFYLVKTGCQWRQLPKDFPPYSIQQYTAFTGDISLTVCGKR